MTDAPLKVGDVLWYVPRHARGQGYGQTVAKIGRKWATMNDGRATRMDLTTWRADGGGNMSPGSFYRTREDYDAQVALSTAWQSLTRTMANMGRPSHIGLAEINTIRELLGIPK